MSFTLSVRSVWLLFAQSVVIFLAASFVFFIVVRSDDLSHLFSRGVSRALPSIVSIYGKHSEDIENSVGSGVVVSEEGHILTNYHLIANVHSIEVRTSEKDSFVAELIGIDPEIDIAVLRIHSVDVPAIVLADEKDIKPGSIVFAIGNPFGLNRSATMGIVSAIGRDRLGLNGYERFIQTDAAINPGSSGGALTNVHGDLVGINSALYYRQSGLPPQGIGFAIPAGIAMRSFQNLISSFPAHDNVWGFEMYRLSSRLLEEIENLPADAENPLLISKVWKNTIAAKLGLEVGDILLDVDGGPPEEKVENGRLSSLSQKMTLLRYGEKILITLPVLE